MNCAVRRVESIKSFLMDRFYVSHFRFSLVLWKCATTLNFRMSSNSYDHLEKKTILWMVQRGDTIIRDSYPNHTSRSTHWLINLNCNIYFVWSSSNSPATWIVEPFIHAGIFESICYSIQVHVCCKYFTSLCDSSSPANKLIICTMLKWLLCFAELLEH